MAVPATVKPLDVFISYAHADAEWRQKLQTNLIMLQRRNLIAAWSDREITAGGEWAGQIDERLNRASLILLLITVNFLASEYCYDIEMKRALDRHAEKEARVIPIILRPVDWSNAAFKGLQALPDDGVPITKWKDEDDAFVSITKGIERAVTELNQTTIEHYANFVKRWGVFEGVGRQLTEDEVRHRPNTLRFYRRGGRVQKIQVVNWQLQLTGRHDVPNRSELSRQRLGGRATECQWEFIRDADANLAYEVAKDQANRLVHTLHYPLSASLTKVTAHYENEAGFPIVMAGSGAASVEYSRSGAGYDVEVNYYDSNGRREPDDSGSYGERRDLTPQGLAEKATNLGFDGNAAWHLDGYAGFRAAYDEFGNRTHLELIGLDGTPAWHKEGYSQVKSTFDRYGNQIAAAYFDGAGAAVRLKAGFAKWTAEYDDRGNQVELACFDEAGRATRQADGSSKWKAQFDALGRPVCVTYFDEHDGPIRIRDGYATWTAKYDERDNQVEAAFFDESTTPKPIRHRDGYARLANKFDDLGRVIETEYWDEAGKRTRIKDGYSKEVSTFDGDNVIARHFLDESDQPVLHKDGYASWKATYDKRGKCTEWRCFDEAEKPVRCKLGYSRRTNTYNLRGNVISEAYFDESAHDAVLKEVDANPGGPGPATPLSGSFFLRPANPVMLKDGYASWDANFDERGKQTALVYKGLDGKPVLLPAGNAGWVATYNDRGQRTELAYIDKTGQPVTTRNGFAKWKARYNDRGAMVEQTYLGEADQPARNQDGVNTSIYTVDWRGNDVAVEYRDEAGKPMRHKDGFLKCLRTFNDDNAIDSRTFVGFEGLGYVQVTQRYDGDGNILECAYFDEPGRPAQGEEGVIRWTATYDAHNNRTAQAFFGPDGQPARSKAGFTRWTAAYDVHGRKIDETYEGLDYGDGYLRKTTVFQDADDVLTVCYFDVNGQAVSAPQGHAKLTIKYDEKGNRIEAHYDVRGNPVEVCCFDAQNEPANHQEGWARWTAQYDGRSNRIQEAYFNKDGKPALHPDGYAIWHMKFNERDQEVELAFFDQTDAPTRHKDGYARRTLRHDAAGRPLEMHFFDSQGQPAMVQQGYASLRAEYDDQGNRTGTAYFDVAARAVTPKDADAKEAVA